MQFATKEALYLLLLIPALLFFFRWAGMRKKRRTEAIGDLKLIERLSPTLSGERDRLKVGLFLAAIVCLVLAISRPQWGQSTREVVARGVDVFIALDTSFSMDAADVAPSRMERAKYIANELMSRLQGNRIGLVVFSGEAFTQCPLTLDYGAAKLFLETVTTGIVPVPGTNIVSALERARKGFGAASGGYRVIVLLTDGEQLEGNALELAAELTKDHIVVHTVGIGTPGGEPIPVLNERGEVIDYVRDSDGQPVLSRLDEETVSRLALATGGKYGRLSDSDDEIEKINTAINDMEGQELESQLFRRYEERFYWPLSFAIVLLVVETIIPRRKGVI